MQKKISIMLWLSISKTCIKISSYLKVKWQRKMAALSIFIKISQKFLLFGWYFFNFTNMSICFINVCNMHQAGNESKTNSGYTNVCFTINGQLKMLPCHFRYFHCSNFKMTFEKHFMKMFLTSSKFLLYRKVLHSDNSQSLQKKFFCLLNT